MSDSEAFDIVFHTFQLDSIASSHPISVEVNKPSEINEFFDDITYFKVLFFLVDSNMIFSIFFYFREVF